MIDKILKWLENDENFYTGLLIIFAWFLINILIMI